MWTAKRDWGKKNIIRRNLTEKRINGWKKKTSYAKNNYRLLWNVPDNKIIIVILYKRVRQEIGILKELNFHFHSVRWKRMKIRFIHQMPVSIKSSRIVHNDVERQVEGRMYEYVQCAWMYFCVLLSFAHSDSYSSQMKIKRPSDCCRWTEEERKKHTWLNTCELRMHSI